MGNGILVVGSEIKKATVHKVISVFFFAAVTLVNVGCNSGGGTEDARETQVQEHKCSFEFEIDDELKFFYHVRPDFDYSQVVEDSLDYLLVANKKQHSIDFFRLDNGRKVDSVMLALQGPNGLPRLSNFLYDSDTLYLVNPFSYELILFNRQGIALKRIRVKPDEPFDSVLPRYFTPSQMIKRNEFIYVFGDPDLNPLDVKNYSKGKYAYKINIESGKAESVFDIPKVYKDDSWMINQYFYRNFYDERRDAWLMSFEVDDDIWLYSTTRGAIRFDGKSDLSPAIRKWNRKDVNSKEAYRYYLSNKVYSKIIFDRHHELYYRFVRHPNKQGVIDKDVDAMWDRPFSIVVLDKNMNRIGESMITDKRVGEVHISTERGVYLSYFDEETSIEGEKRYVRLIPNIDVQK